MARKIVGTTDEITTCDQCGRDDLSHTVVIDHIDADGNRTGELAYYGSDCATRIITGKTAPQIEREAKRAQREADQAAADARREAASIQFQINAQPFYAWIKATYGVTVTSYGEIYEQSKALGRKSPFQLRREYENQ